MPYQSIVKKSPKNQIFRTQIFTIKIFANLAQFQPTQATQRNRERAGALQTKIGQSLISGKKKFWDARPEEISTKKFPEKISSNSFSRSQLPRKFAISQNLWYNIRGIYFGWRAYPNSYLQKRIFIQKKMNIYSSGNLLFSKIYCII